ncbi:MAG: caspase family protein [Crocosphaera sp.]|nr:caspase family protein [Crocosphaera sp.]
MDDFRAISIGIDNYVHYSPLRGSENSAQALYRYFFEEANIPDKQLLLLTDTSISSEKRSTYPNHNNILEWINDSSINSKYCWFFFQGYGINYQGEDYLLPIDSGLNNISKTGIQVRALLETLQNKTEQLLVILDLQNPRKDGKLGQLTLNLAQTKAIPLIFSCRSHVYQNISAEKSIFITALIEALRHHSHEITLAKLNRYLQEKLNPFNHHNFPAIALPIIISPSVKVSHQPLLAFVSTQEEVVSKKKNNLSFTIKQKSPPTPQKQPINTVILPKLPPPSSAPPLPLQIRVTPRQKTKSPLEPIQPIPKNKPPSLLLGIGKFLLWAGGVLGAIVLLWLMSSQVRQHLNSLHHEKIEENEQILNRANLALSRQQASSFHQAIAYARQIQPHTPLYGKAQSNIRRWSRVILDIAQARATQKDFQGAISAANLVPQDEQKLYLLAQQWMTNWQALQQQKADNEVLMEAALSLIKPNNASSYNRAIRTLKHLKKGELGYKKAQTMIEQFSDQIYHLAQTRAAKGKLKLAIETVELVPHSSQIYEKAQKEKISWQKSFKNSQKN